MAATKPAAQEKQAAKQQSAAAAGLIREEASPGLPPIAPAEYERPNLVANLVCDGRVALRSDDRRQP